jgi:hypothetical protein
MHLFEFMLIVVCNCVQCAVCCVRCAAFEFMQCAAECGRAHGCVQQCGSVRQRARQCAAVQRCASVRLLGSVHFFK